MLEFIDKRGLWQQVLAKVQEESGFDAYTMIQGQAYLDSVERGMAMIGVKSWQWIQTLERKRVHFLLQSVFSELMKQPVKIKLVLGHPRLIEKAPKPKAKLCGQCHQLHDICICEYGPHPEPRKAPEINWSHRELGALHEQYGDIMGIIHKHPVFVHAITPIEQGGWGIFPEILTNACKDYGAHVVLKGLRQTGQSARVKQPRAYFLDNLEAGRYGHKLGRSAEIIGPISGR